MGYSDLRRSGTSSFGGRGLVLSFIGGGGMILRGNRCMSMAGMMRISSSSSRVVA